MALATLSIDLQARLANLQQGMDRAARLAQQNAAAIEARYNKLKNVAAGIGAALGSAFAVGGVSAFFRATVDGVAKLKELKDATGASIENLSALEDIATRTGTSMDTAGKAVIKMNQALNAALPGSNQARALQALGLDVQALRRLDPAEALRQVSVAMNQFAEEGNKARAAQFLFGEEIKVIAPLLKNLGVEGEYVAKVTTEQALEAEKFNNQLASMNKNVTDLSREIAGPLLSGLNQVFDAINNRGVGGFEALNAAVVVPLQTLTVLGANLSFVFRSIGRDIGGLWAQIAATSRGDFAGSNSIAEQMRIDAVAARKEFDALERRLMSIGTVLPQASYSNEGYGRQRVVADLSDPTKPAGTRATTAATPARPDFAGTPLDPLIQAAIQRLQDTDVAKLGQLRLELDALLELGGDSATGAQGEALRRIREEIERLDPAQAALAASRARLNELLSATPSGQLDAALRDITLINAEYERGLITLQQWAELAELVTARLPQGTADALEELSEMAQQFQRNVQNIMGDSIANVLTGRFDSIADAWKSMLLNMVAQVTAADLAKRLFGADGSGGWLGQALGFLGFAKGGAFANGAQVTAFADGGVLNRPTFFGMSGGRMGVAGEAGAEGVFPLERGADGKLGVRAFGAGGVTNHYHVAAGVTRGELVTALQLVSQQTEARVMQRLAVKRVV